MKIFMHCPTRSEKIETVHLGKVAEALESPNDILAKAYVPNGQVKVVSS